MKIRNWIISILASALLIAAVYFIAVQPLPEVPVYDGELRFDATQSMHYLAELVTRFPQRDYTHSDRQEAAYWLEEQFRATGLEVFTQDFDEVIAGEEVTGLRNVYAVLPGQRPEAILVVGHYDIPPFVTQGAADDGSGVAATLELARIFASEGTPRWTMIFMASDSEEYGAMCGSFNFLEKSGWKDKLAAVIALDLLNMGEMKAMKVRGMSIQQGYVPLWLREMSLQAVALETSAVDTPTWMEWVERSVAIAPTEHGVFLRSGIPAVNLTGAPVDQAWHSGNYHTTGDTIDKIWPESMDRYGRATERILRAMQSMEHFPEPDMFYLKTGVDQYIPGLPLRIMQLLALLPLVFGVFASWKAAVNFTKENVWNEIRRFITFLGAGALGYLTLWLASENGLMIKYELYPATQKDPALNNPQLLPLILTVAAIVIGYLILNRLLRPGKGDAGVGRTVGLSGMLILIVTAIFFDAGFAALAFLAPAILFWPLVGGGRSLTRRVINGILAVSITFIFGAFIFLFSKLYYIGHVWWYILMCASYGLFRARAVFTFLAAAALAILFFKAAIGYVNTRIVSK